MPRKASATLSEDELLEKFSTNNSLGFIIDALLEESEGKVMQTALNLSRLVSSSEDAKFQLAKLFVQKRWDGIKALRQYEAAQEEQKKILAENNGEFSDWRIQYEKEQNEKLAMEQRLRFNIDVFSDEDLREMKRGWYEGYEWRGVYKTEKWLMKFMSAEEISALTPAEMHGADQYFPKLWPIREQAYKMREHDNLVEKGEMFDKLTATLVRAGGATGMSPVDILKKVLQGKG